MANTSVIRQQAAPTTYQLSSPSCSTKAIQKKPVITGTKMCEEKRAYLQFHIVHIVKLHLQKQNKN